MALFQMKVIRCSSVLGRIESRVQALASSEMPLGQQQPQGMHAPSHFIKPLGETNHREVFHDDIEVENTIGSFNAGVLTARQLVRWLVCILIVVLCLSDLYCGLYVQQAARSLLRIAGP